MTITNWLARAEGNYGLVFPDEFTNVETRIYGKVYDHPNFKDGEYVQTGIVKSYMHSPDVRITTVAEERFWLKNREPEVYVKYLEARWNKSLTILKYWKVVDGCLVGKTLNGTEISGKVVRQNFKENICKFEDGTLVFVDWLSRAEDYVPNCGYEEFLVFGIERCMPDIFGKHFRMFKKY